MDRFSEDQRRSFLKDEYLFLQAQYEDYDKRSLIIKSWVASGATAALALAFYSSVKWSILIPVFVTVITCTVWYLEACWKLFQYALSDRIRIIEAYFRADPDIIIKNPDPFQIYNFWFRSYTKDAPIYPYEQLSGKRPARYILRLKDAALQPFVYLPYLPILGLSLFSFLMLIGQ